MHDVGNPPFGHFGEKTIQSWFERNNEKYRARFSQTVRKSFDRSYLDFEQFDGNPQGFRMATKLQWVNDEFGYNLTHTQLAAMLKYPWATDKVGRMRGDRKIKKAGVFLTEADRLATTLAALSMAEDARHPLAYLMEAADDISYCLSDIEDAFEKNVVRGEDFVRWMDSTAGKSKNKVVLSILRELPRKADDLRANASVLAWYVKFRTDMTNELVRQTADLFVEHQKEILRGSYFDLLDKSEAAKVLLDAVKAFSAQNLYTSRIVRQRELVGFEVLSGILDRFGLLLDLPSVDAHELLSGKSPRLDSQFRLAPTLYSFLSPKQTSSV